MNTADTDAYRHEHDHLGEVQLTRDQLFGVQTVRGAENFALSGRKLGSAREFVRAFAQCKQAAAMANHELGQLSVAQRDAIVEACESLAEGELDDQMIVDLLEGSGGTSTNMNINEVVANKAQLLLGKGLGQYDTVHPNDHVNRSQSTNDVYPAALKLATYAMLPAVTDELRLLARSFGTKAEEFADILHLGRTCMQDAQPMRLGQLFGGYAALTERLADEIELVRTKLTTLPLGGTAIGTGFGSVRGYKEAVHRHLTEITGTVFHPASDPFDAMQNLDVFARVSGELKTAAASLGKIATDLILLSSGPVGGLGEIVLPAVQAGSSIMPGKVNPVIPMSMSQIGYILVGNDATIAQAVQAGQLEINHFEPVIADRLFESIQLLERGVSLFRTRCIDGITASEIRNETHLLTSSAVATALVPRLGYAAVSDIVRQSQAEGVSLMTLLETRQILTSAETELLVRQATEVVA